MTKNLFELHLKDFEEKDDYEASKLALMMSLLRQEIERANKSNDITDAEIDSLDTRRKELLKLYIVHVQKTYN